MDGLEYFDVQEEVVRCRRVKPQRIRVAATSWSKILNRILFCLVSQMHKHMLWFSNEDETQFQVMLKNKKSPSWGKKDISLFVDLDTVLHRKWPKFKYEEKAKGRFRANMSKFEDYGYIRKVNTKKNREVSETIITYEILRSECLANARLNALKNCKEVTKKNKQGKYTKKNKVLTEIVKENFFGEVQKADCGSKEFALNRIGIENNFLDIMVNNLGEAQNADCGSQEFALRGIAIENNLGRVQETDKMDFSYQELLEENDMKDNLGQVQEANVIKDQYWFQGFINKSEYNVSYDMNTTSNVEIPNIVSTNMDGNEYITLDNMIYQRFQNNLNSSIAGDNDLSTSIFTDYSIFKPPLISENPESAACCDPEEYLPFFEIGDPEGKFPSQDILELDDTWLTNFKSFKNEDLK